MQSFILLFLLGVVSTAMGAAFHPIYQRQDVSPSSDICGQSITTITETVTSPPTTVTVAIENPAQISASISSDLSIESMYLSDQSELAPVSAPTVTTINKLTITEVVPVVEATLTTSPAKNTGPYFVSVGPNTTDWSFTDYTPVSSVTIGITTVTLSPVPPMTAASPTTTVRSTFYMTLTTRKTKTSTFHHPFPLSTGGVFTGSNSYGWNATSNSSTIATGVSGSISILPIPNVATYTTVTNLTTVFVTANITAYPTMSITTTATCSDEAEYGYGFGLGCASPSSYEAGPGKRQVCTLVYATLNGDVVSWCNNWDGSSAEVQTSFSTTYTPSSGTSSTAPAASSQPADSPLSSTIIESPIPVTPILTTTSSAAAATTSCGLSGGFEINFDDLPTFSTSDNVTAESPPIFNPYEHLFWSDGWTYVPPPSDPYPPQSGSLLGEYIPPSATTSSTSGSPDAGDVPDGAIGAGPRNYNSAYWFNVASAYIGCYNDATDPSVICDFVATGYQYNADNGDDEVVVTEHFPQPPCPGFVNCELRQIFFNSQFQGLSALSFYAAVQGQQQKFFIDSIEMGWWNNTCAAGLERVSSR